MIAVCRQMVSEADFSNDRRKICDMLALVIPSPSDPQKSQKSLAVQDAENLQVAFRMFPCCSLLSWCNKADVRLLESFLFALGYQPHSDLLPADDIQFFALQKISHIRTCCQQMTSSSLLFKKAWALLMATLNSRPRKRLVRKKSLV
jgi:hypothetical protein